MLGLIYYVLLTVLTLWGGKGKIQADIGYVVSALEVTILNQRI